MAVECKRKWILRMTAKIILFISDVSLFKGAQPQDGEDQSGLQVANLKI